MKCKSNENGILSLGNSKKCLIQNCDHYVFRNYNLCDCCNILYWQIRNTSKEKDDQILYQKVSEMKDDPQIIKLIDEKDKQQNKILLILLCIIFPPVLIGVLVWYLVKIANK